MSYSILLRSYSFAVSFGGVALNFAKIVSLGQLNYCKKQSSVMLLTPVVFLICVVA